MATTKVNSEFIAVNAISGTIIADGAITSTHLAANSVDTAELVTGSIDTIHIAANQVTSAKIVSDAVLTRHIADDQVTQALIAVNSVGISELAVTEGSDGQVLTTNGSGTLSFATVSGTTINNNADNRVITGSGTANTLEGEANLTFDGSTLAVTGALTASTGVVVQGSGTTAGVYLNGTNSDTATQGNFVRYGTNFATQSNANNSLLITKAFNGSTFLDAFTVKSDGSVGIGTTTTFSNPLTLNKAAGAANSLNNQIALTHTGASTAYHIKTIRAAGTDEPAGLAFVENTTERMRIDSTGKVGIGATTIDEKLHIEVSSGDAAIKLEDASGDYIRIDQNSVGANDKIRFKSGSSLTERARITSTGDFLSNTTTAVSSFYNGASGLGFGYSAGGYGAVVRTATNTPLYISTTGSGNTRFIEFYNGTTVRGGINWNGSTLSAVTGSDYRLKENIAPIQNALTRINTLNPVSYDMIDTGVSGEGFLAHEAQTVIPYAVIGTKDEVYEADNVPEEKEDQIGQPKYQMMDYAKLTPLLVKAVQEQQTIIDDLKSRIETLEG